MDGIFQEFVKAVIAYQKKLNSEANIAKGPKLNKEQENKRRMIVRSFSIAKDMYIAGSARTQASVQQSELEPGAVFLQVFIIHTPIFFSILSLFFWELCIFYKLIN